MPPRAKPPAYCRHRSHDQAYVRFGDQFHYLGQYGSAESQRRYARLLAEWAAGGGQPPGEIGEPTVADVFAAFWADAKMHYRDARTGEPTSELGNHRSVGELLLRLYADLPAGQFGRPQLKAVRQEMIARGWTRKSINRMIGRVVWVFRQAEGDGLYPGEQLRRLETLPGIRKGRPGVADRPPVRPVSQATVDATCRQLAPSEWIGVQRQALTGMRSSELVAMRPEMIDRSGEVWLYRAPSKSAHLDIERIVLLGPVAQMILQPLMDRTPPGRHILRPGDAWEWRRAKRAAERTTPIGQGSRRGHYSARSRRKRAKKTPAGNYTSRTWYQAIRYAIRRAGCEHWHPHQLRHAAGTRIECRFGREAAKATLGHRHLTTTEIYAERDLATARKVAMEIG